MGILSEKRTGFIEVEKVSQANSEVLNREK